MGSGVYGSDGKKEEEEKEERKKRGGRWGWGRDQEMTGGELKLSSGICLTFP